MTLIRTTRAIHLYAQKIFRHSIGYRFSSEQSYKYILRLPFTCLNVLYMNTKLRMVSDEDFLLLYDNVCCSYKFFEHISFSSHNERMKKLIYEDNLTDDAKFALSQYINNVHIPGKIPEHEDVEEKEEKSVNYRNYEIKWKTKNKFKDGCEDVLLKLLQKRLEHAKNAGFCGYSEFLINTQYSLASSSNEINIFLQLLIKHLKPLVKEEIAYMKLGKGRDGYVKKEKDIIFPWDPPRYIGSVRDQYYSQIFKGKKIEQGISIEGLMKGLQEFSKQVLGISLRPEKHNSKDELMYSVVDEDRGLLLGYLYFNLSPSTNLQPLMIPDRYGVRSILPIARIKCPFPQNLRINLSNWLSYSAPLFHEFGHALHFILLRSAYYKSSAFRQGGPNDFLEIPSILMENLSVDPRVMSIVFAANGIRVTTTHKMKTPFVAIEYENDVVTSMLDQVLHSDQEIKSTLEISDFIVKKYSHLPLISGIAKHHHDSLFYNSYGGSIYSYLWARSMANLIYYELFDESLNKVGSKQRLKEFLSEDPLYKPKDSLKKLIGRNFTLGDMVKAFTKPITVNIDMK